MSEISNVFSDANGVVWVTPRGRIVSASTPGSDGYTASVFHETNSASCYVLRKAPDLSRLVFAEGSEVRAVVGTELAAMGDLSSQTDEQIINALI